MLIANAHAILFLHGNSRIRTVVEGRSWAGELRSVKVQAASAISAGIAQNASASDHDPSDCAMGTVRAPPRAAPTMRAAIQVVVALPRAWGSCSLTIPGMSPATNAMPTPARKAERKSNSGAASTARSNVATLKETRAKITKCLRPKRIANAGTVSAKIPMHKTGIVVRTPIVAELQPVVATMSLVRVGRLDRTGRRFTATRATAVSTSHDGGAFAALV